MSGRLFGIVGTELPSRRLSTWLERHGPAPEGTEARQALAAREWPAVVVVNAAAVAAQLGRLASTWSDARFLFLIEEPSTALAAALPLPDGVTIAEWSTRQEVAVQSIRRHLQRHPVRSLCLVLQELADAPQAAGDLLRDRLGVTVHVDADLVHLEGPSELNRALASMLLAPEKQLAHCTAELLATCQPLADLPADGRSAQPDGGLVLRELATLTEHAAVGPRLRAQIAEFESRNEQLDQRLAESERARTDLTARLARLGAEVELARKACESQQETLRVAQARLEQETAGKHQLAAMLDARSAELAEARTCARPPTDETADELKLLAAEAEAHQADAARLSSSPAHTALQRENELLLVHLHEVQEELEQYLLEQRALVQRFGRVGSGVPLFVEECQVERVRDVRPHLELELRLRGVRLGEALTFEQLKLRLVEHNARPGVVLALEPGLARQFLSSWVETGLEGASPYMLIIPSDSAGRACLQTLPTSDWDALLALVHCLNMELAEAPATKATRWPAVAGHLARQLAELPPKLRYDRLKVTRAADTYTITFGNLIFGERRLDLLQLQWQPDAALPLAVLAPASPDSMPPLDEWPRNNEGKREPSVTVPVGKLGFLHKRRQWLRLSATDRGLLLGLLDALPAVAQAGRADGLLADAQAVRLRSGAQHLLRDALAASGQREPLLGRVAQRLRARWRGPGTPAGASHAATP